MNTSEWALVLFTVASQMAVGAFIVLGFLHYYAMKTAGLEEADRMSDRALLAIGPVLVLGILASLLHLGNPMGAYRAISNLNTSWLSREILFNVLFAGTGAVFALMQWRKIGSFQVRMAVAVVAAGFGLALVYSMSKIYMLTTQPAWNIFATPFAFFTTTLLLGALAIGAALVANFAYLKSKNPECSDVQCDLLRTSLRWVALVSIALLGISFVVTPLYMAYLASGTGAAAATAARYFFEYPAAFVARLVLAFLGAGVLAAFLYQNSYNPGKEKLLGVLAYSAFALVLVSEVLGRYFFYATQVQIGL